MAGIAPLGFGEFPDDHNPEFMSLRLNAMGNSFLDGIESLPIIGDSRFTTALTSRLRALAQAIKSAARPIFSRFLNVMRPKSTSELGLSAAQHGAVPLGSYSKKNDVLVTSDSLETVAMRLDLVRNAEQRILLSGNYCGGRVFNDFLDAVEQRMAERPALEVFVLSSDELLEEDNIERVQR
ncbi:MAG: hypothetical protein KDK78_10605, partial [Chlamydiia bacterium]|nr:hypothetical protein [Chlamydiia bacterium]